MNTIDRFGLTWAEHLFGIQAPRPFEQALAAQDFMTAGNAAGEIVLDIEYGAVAVGDFGIQRQQIAIDRAAIDGGVNPCQLFDRPSCPH